MEAWKLVAVVFAAPVAIGTAVDTLLARSQRSAMYDWAEHQWLRLSYMQVSDLPGNLAARALAAWSFVTERRASAWLASVVISTILTAVCALLGRTMRYAVRDPDTGVSADSFIWGAKWYIEALLRGLYLPALITNWIFDVTTVLITAYFLKHVAASTSGVRRLFFLACDAVAALALACGCLLAAHLATTAMLGNTYGNDLGRAFGAFSALLMLRPMDADPNYLDDAAFASTTLLPTIAFEFVLLVLIIAKAVISATRWCTMHWLRLTAEPPKGDAVPKLRPFFLLGTFLGVVGLLAKLVADGLDALKG